MFQLNKNLQNTNTNISKIKTYVGSDGKLHFVDSAGADSVLPFNKDIKLSQFKISYTNVSYTDIETKVGYYYYILVPWSGADNKELKLISGGVKIAGGYGWTTRQGYLVVRATSTKVQIYRDYLSEGSNNTYFVFESEAPITE